MGGCAAIFVLLLVLGAAIALVEFVVRTPWAVIAILVVALIAFVDWMRGLFTPEAKRRREETLRLHDAEKRVARLKAEAEAERLHSTIVKDRLRLEAEEERLRAEIDASLEKRMRG